MHELVGVLVTPDVTRATAREAVEKMLRPHEEQWNEDEETLTGWWDFWSVGGRWTGIWSTPDYQPHEDPRNRGDRPCFICRGTGHRPDIGNWDRAEYIAWCGGCNGCRGTGWYPPHPSEYAPVAEDVMPVRRFLDSDWMRAPRRLVLPDAGVHCRDDWAGDTGYEYSTEWDAHVRSLLMPFSGAGMVAVDVHS